MLGFSPIKKRANKFNYVPRYYDPAKEAREERRAELRGERAEDANREYRPGQYIRTQREARDARRQRESQKGRTRTWKIIGAGVFIILFLYILYPKFADVFIRAQQSPAQREAVVKSTTTRTSELDQSGISDVEWQEQVIEMVPNDYKEGE